MINRFAPTVQSIDQQIADLQMRARGSNAGDNRDEISRLMNQRNSMVQQQATAQAGSGNPWDSVQGARDQTFGLATGRLNDLKGDSVDAQITKELQDRINGTTNPYDANTINALKTQQAEQAAQVQGNTLARLRSGGGSASDPSYQSGVQEANAARQASAQQANLAINSQANVANYDAKTNAVGGLAGFNAGRNGAITNQSNYLSGLYGNISANHETPAQVQVPQDNGLANYAAWQSYFNSQSKPSAPAVQAPTAASVVKPATNYARPGTPGSQLQGPPAPAGTPATQPGTPAAAPAQQTGFFANLMKPYQNTINQNRIY